jgi:hypothetical protein
MTMAHRRRIRLLLAVILLAVSSAVWAGSELEIRQVAARKDGEGVGPGLQDIQTLLSENMPFKSYRLLASKKTPLPAAAEVGLAEGYSVACKGEQGNLDVVIRRKKAELLRTTATLRDGKPLILGGFPGADSSILIILLTK